MGDLPYISSEQVGLIIHTELIYEYTIYKRPIPNFELKREWWAYNNISWAYNTYTVYIITCSLARFAGSMRSW